MSTQISKQNPCPETPFPLPPFPDRQLALDYCRRLRPDHPSVEDNPVHALGQIACDLAQAVTLLMHACKEREEALQLVLKRLSGDDDAR